MMRGVTSPRPLVLPLLLAGVVLASAAAPAAAVEPTRSDYESPQVTETPDGTRLQVTKGPAGLYFTYALDPSTRYRVEVSGEQSLGAATLRVRDDARTTYDRAPHGSLTFTITGTQVLELLFYSDTEADYLIRSVRVTECPACRTDADLKSQVLAEVTGLSGALAQDPYAAAELLLHWASPRIAFAGASPAPIATSRTSAADLWYENFQPASGGVFCKGAAEFLQRLMRLFGLGAFTIEFGDTDDSLTHAAVVVPVVEHGTTRFHMLDPSFDLNYLIRPSGERADVFQLLELLRMGSTARIGTQTGDLGPRQILKPGGAVACSSGSGISTACSLADYLAGWRDALERNGYRTDEAALIELLRNHVFEVGPSSDPAARQEFEEKLKAFLDGGQAATVPSPPTLAGAGRAADPVRTRSPRLRAIKRGRVRGRHHVGAVVTCTPGRWKGGRPRLRYRWLRDGRPIHGATRKRRRLTSRDAGHRVSCRITARLGRQRAVITTRSILARHRGRAL